MTSGSYPNYKTASGENVSLRPVDPPPPYTPSYQPETHSPEAQYIQRLNITDHRAPTAPEQYRHAERLQTASVYTTERASERSLPGKERDHTYEKPNRVGNQETATSEATEQRNRRDQLIQSFRQIGSDEINVFVPNSSVTYEDQAKRIRKVEIGKAEPGSKVKVIMVVGATGSGKTTLINGMFNYILGVDWKDDYRLKLIEESTVANQAISQTTWITSYIIHHRAESTVPYTLVIIDTPEFGDTAGIRRDQ